MRHRFLCATLALVMAGQPALAAARRSGSELRFSDVPGEHWAVDYIRRTVNAGLLQGYEGKFLGNSPINRYQMAQILSRLMDRMGSLAGAAGGGGGDGPSSEIFLQIADEVANLNVAQSSLEEKVVQLRYDLEALRNGEVGGGPKHGPGHAHAPKISPEEWDDRVRTQAPAGFAALAVFASAALLKGLK